MSRRQCDSDSSDDNNSMENPPGMKSSKRRLEELLGKLADVNCLRDEFNKLYEEDYPKLQQGMEKLHNIIRTFERDFRSAAKGARDGGAVGIAGGVGLIAGLVLAPFTAGASLVVAGAGAAAAAGGGVYGGLSSSEKQKKIAQIRKDIEAELKEFQNIINPFSDKMKEINERIEGILKDLDKLERDAIGVSEYLASTSGRHNIRREDLTRLTEQMSITMILSGTLAAIFPEIWLLLELLGVLENSRAVDDMDYLANKPVNEQIDKSKMTSKAGEFIAGMRNVVYKLQNIMDEIKKTKQTMTFLENNLTNKTIAFMN